MATTGIISAQGTTLANDTLSTVGQVVNIDISGVTYEDVDLTALNDIGKRYIQGQKDPGQITFTVYYGKTQAEDIFDLWTAGTIDTWTVTFGGTAGATFVAEGFITELGGEIPDGSGAITQSITVQLTGDITYASPA